MSFTDTIGNSWSALFSSVDALTTFLLALGAVIMHVSAHTNTSAEADEPAKAGSGDRNKMIKCIFPSINTSTSPSSELQDNNLLLTVGMGAGE
jgi:hypothetical protein